MVMLAMWRISNMREANPGMNDQQARSAIGANAYAGNVANHGFRIDQSRKANKKKRMPMEQ